MIRLKTMTATQMRLMLSLSLFLITFITCIGFYVANSYLKNYAVEVSHVSADATASRDNLQNLQKVEKELADKKDVVQKASSIVAESQSYLYQDQIINDLNGYAANAGVSIINIDFSSTQTTTTTPGTTPTPTTPIPSGVKSSSATITLKNPINYTNLLKFIKSIEQNLTKMQISRINLSKDATGGVTSDVLTLQVYVR